MTVILKKATVYNQTKDKILLAATGKNNYANWQKQSSIILDSVYLFTFYTPSLPTPSLPTPSLPNPSRTKALVTTFTKFEFTFIRTVLRCLVEIPNTVGLWVKFTVFVSVQKMTTVLMWLPQKKSLIESAKFKCSIITTTTLLIL